MSEDLCDTTTVKVLVDGGVRSVDIGDIFSSLGILIYSLQNGQAKPGETNDQRLEDCSSRASRSILSESINNDEGSKLI